MQKRLEIGCRQKRDGWTTLDCVGEPDILATLPELPETVLAGNWDVITAVHVLEHFYLQEARQLLRLLYKSLATGGRLVLELPNIEFAAKVLLGLERGDRQVYGMRAFYGVASRESPEMLHRWGWTPATLSQEFEDCGFSSVRIERAKYHYPERDFRIVGVK
jgi:predicted SAM-dependent methyltransferase